MVDDPDPLLAWQTAATVVATWRPQGVTVENLAVGATLVAEADVLLILALCAESLTADELRDRLTSRGLEIDHDELLRSLAELTQAGVLHRSDSSDWPGRAIAADPSWADWGTEAQYLHFVTKDAPYIEAPQDQQDYLDQLGAGPQPALFKTYQSAPRIPLPRLRSPDVRSYTDVLTSRRTVRKFSDDQIPLTEFASTLHDAFAPQQFISANVFGCLPFRNYANAGARSEAEVYINVLNVSDLDHGLYHYNAYEHSLEYLRPALSRKDLEHLSYEQPMIYEAGAVMFVSAVVARLAHKYKHPRSLRAMYMDMGHIGQVFAMCATNRGLGPNQTAAFRDSEVESELGLDGIEETVLYCLGLGVPASETDYKPMGLDSAQATTFVHNATFVPAQPT